jgi:hypothetical protein
MFSINSFVPLRRQRRQHIERAIEMGDHTVARHGKQRIGLAGTEDDPAGAEFAGAAHEFCQEIERIGAHFLRGGGDVDIDIRHVDGNQPQPSFAEVAQRANL